MKLLQSKLTGWSLGMNLPRRAVPNQQYMHLHGVRLVRFDCLVCFVGALFLFCFVRVSSGLINSFFEFWQGIRAFTYASECSLAELMAPTVSTMLSLGFTLCF
jgi:hypothetical protein